MDIYIQLKRSSTENNVNSHHLNQAELSKLFKNIAHCITSSAVSTFCECQFCSTVLSAHSMNVNFTLQCCQHILWMSVLHYSAVSTFFEHQFCITVLSACSVNVSFVSQCCQHVLWRSILVAYSTKWHYITGNKTLLVHQQQKHSNPFSCPAILLYAKSMKPTLENKKARGKEEAWSYKCFPKGVSLHQTKQTRLEPLCVKTALRVKQSGLKVKQGGSWVKDSYAGRDTKEKAFN